MWRYLENDGKEIIEDDDFDQEEMLRRLDQGLPMDDFEEI